MKKLCIVVIVLTIGINQVKACDICGGGVSNSNPFMFPHLSKTYLGISYTHKSFIKQSGEETSTFHYNTMLATGQFSINKKIMIIGMVPYELNRKVDNHGVKTIIGLGDVSLLANYKLWTKNKNNNIQTILVGGGFEFPFQLFNTPEGDQVENQNFQLSSGSIDYLVNGSYHLNLNKWMFSLAGSYKYNTDNKDEYRFGDILTGAATCVYRKDWEKFSVSPYVQMMCEKQMNDANKHVIQNYTGGHVYYTGGGIDVNTRKIAVGINYQFVQDQNLAHGTLLAKPRFTTHISFIL